MKKCLARIIFLQACLYQVVAIHSQSWVSLDGTKHDKGLTISVIESDATIHKVKMTIHGFHDNNVVVEGKEYHQIFMDEGVGLQKAGEPQLPTITQSIAIPYGASYKISILEEKWQDIECGTIFPAQYDSKNSNPIPPFTIKDEAYKQKVYSPFVVSKGWEQNWRNIHNVSFSICPFKYYPVQNKLSVLTEFLLQVDFIGSSNKSSIRQKDLEKAISWHLFDNDIGHFPVKNVGTKSSTSYDYLIIVGDSSILESQALSDFTKWKAFKGYKTKVVSTDTTGTNASDIKSYISQEFEDNGIEYVLLIGDCDKIPLNYLNITTEYPETAHGDYWYGCLEGGDNDYDAEIPIGRFSTNSLTEFQNMVNKTISYERFYKGNSSNALLVAHKQYPLSSSCYQQCCEKIKRDNDGQLLFTTAYGASGATNNDVINHINNDGMNIVNYRGHGNPTNWLVWNNANENFGSTQIANIDSTSIFFNICCKTGDITNNPCMMEQLTLSSKGALACLAAVDSIWRLAGNVYNQKLFSVLLDSAEQHIGLLNIKAQKSTMKHYVNDDEIYLKKAIFNAYTFLCGGDPTLDIWINGPYSVSCSDISYSNSNGIISLYVSSLSDYNVALVSESGEYIDFISSSGSNCSFSIPQGNFYAVLNSSDHYPYIMFFSSSNYIQNETILANSYYNYNVTPLSIGYDVTTEIPNGNVKLKSGSKLSIQNGSGGVTIKNGFECEKGAELTIQ